MLGVHKEACQKPVNPACVHLPNCTTEAFVSVGFCVVSRLVVLVSVVCRNGDGCVVDVLFMGLVDDSRAAIVT